MTDTTTTATTSSSSTGSSILTSLGAGTGIDTSALIDKLSTATFLDKEKAQTSAETANTSQISELATLSSAINSFSTALSSLISGGTLRTQPTSSDSTVLTATAQAGATLGGLSAQVTVKQLAKAQSLVSGYFGSSTSAIGAGGLSITVGSGAAATTTSITLTSANDTLAGIAAAINASGAGVTATVVSDSSGARLQIKGATGAANAFTIAPAQGSDAALNALQWPQSGGTGMSLAQGAQDAVVNLDGVDVSRASNTIGDLIPGVTLNLIKESPATAVSLGATRPTDAITSAVSDFVTAYNSLKSELDTATANTTTGAAAGPFNNNSSIRQMRTMLSRITSTVLNSAGGPSTLAEIGVATARDGTLSVDSTTLSKMLATYPDGVEAMFNPTQHSSSALITITSAMGAAKPGTYTLTNIVPASGGTLASGSIGDLSGQPNADGTLSASPVGDAAGLSILPTGAVASATITVDAGIGGALQAIRDLLQSNNGILKSLSDTLTTQKTTLADARTKLTNNESDYKDRLTTQFTAMDTAVAAYKSTQSFLTQQIAQWSKSS